MRSTSRSAYRELLDHEIEPNLIEDIRRATNGNFALGSERFETDIATALGRRASPGKSGRPRKQAAVESADLFDD